MEEKISLYDRLAKYEIAVMGLLAVLTLLMLIQMRLGR